MNGEGTLPLFPLNLVLFPGMPLALHIFEPRYRSMVEDCLANNEGFVVALSREEPGREDGACSWATLATIEQVVRFPDGRMNIKTLGQGRVRLLDRVDGAPYPRARVVAAPDVGSLPGERALVSLRRTYREYAALLGRLAALPLPDDLPDDPERASWVASWALHTDTFAKQHLLECPGTLERLDAVRDRLEDELGRLRAFADSLEGNGYFFVRGMRFSRN
jgi:Lon protease-like protein